MFTGLVEALGEVEDVASGGAGRRLRIATPLAEALALGESVAVNGVCLTVASLAPSAFDADVSPETLRVTTLGTMRPGRRVNLERSLRADGRLGGHFVLGHVDGVARVAARVPEAECLWIEIDLPPALLLTVILKGSIAIDGVSLTVARLDAARVAMQIVPFTAAHTTLGALSAGETVNVETDMLGKYVQRLLPREP
jgi:riboflavin synthase